MYLVVSCYFISISIWEQIKSKAANTELAIGFSSILLAVLAGIRYNVGTDYPTYFKIFQGLLHDPHAIPKYQLEIGWRYISYCLSFLGANVYGVFAFWACLSVALLYYGLRKFSPYPLLSFCCFFFVYNAPCLYAAMRQCVVMCILIASIGLIEERKHIKLFFVFLFAISIHSSAIVLPLFYTLLQIKRIEKFGFLILVIALIAGLLSIPKNLVFELGPIVMPKFIYTKAHSYLTYWATSSLSFVNIAQRMLVLIPAIVYYKPLVQNSKYNETIIKLYFWGCVVYFLFADSYQVATRLNTTTKILDIIILPSFLSITENKMRVFFFLLIVLWGISILYSFLFLAEYRDGCYPFRTIFGHTLQLH